MVAVVELQNAETELQSNRVKEKEVWANGEFRFFYLETECSN